MTESTIRNWLGVTLFQVIVCVLCSQAPRVLQHDYSVRIAQASGIITVDGLLDEDEWERTEVADNSWMSAPIDGIHVVDELQTEIRLTYDDTYIYISAKCMGNGPHVIPSLKRDATSFWRGDVFAVVVEPVNEQTNGFVLK